MPRKKESATNPFEKGAAAAKTKRVQQDKMTQGEEPKRKESESVTTGVEKPAVESTDDPLVTANFKIPASYRKKMKMYAVAHDTTTVALLLDMIDHLPEM